MALLEQENDRRFASSTRWSISASRWLPLYTGWRSEAEPRCWATSGPWHQMAAVGRNLTECLSSFGS